MVFVYLLTMKLLLSFVILGFQGGVIIEIMVRLKMLVILEKAGSATKNPLLGA